MSVESLPINQQENRAIICLCILAAFADGSENEGERARILAILGGFVFILGNFSLGPGFRLNVDYNFSGNIQNGWAWYTGI
jgi:hypothetical protein